MRVKGVFFISIVLVLLASIAFSQNDHIKLLAVTQTDTGVLEQGQVVDLNIEVYPGEGRVFIDSYPLTKLDTQVSTRFANKFACDYANIDCSKLDFIYTIRSNSPIIGGPSASAAIAALTIAKLTHSDIDESVALTGTLNSGGIIGEVGGVDKKILAAKNAGITKVLIPKGTIYEGDDNSSQILTQIGFPANTTVPIVNKTNNITNQFNWTKFGNDNDISVVEVLTISDVLSQFGVSYQKKVQSSGEIDQYYINTMQSLAQDLCGDAKNSSGNFKNTNETKDAYDVLDRGEQYYSMEKYYSSASQCFVSLSDFKFYELKQDNLTKKEFNNDAGKLEDDIDTFLIPKYTTIMDLQAYAIVKERLADAKTSLDDAIQEVNNSKNITFDALNNMAYAIERYNTAKSWTTFITHHGTVLKLDEASLKSACEDNLQQAQELKQYVDLYIPPEYLDTSQDSLDIAEQQYSNGQYELCLFSASQSQSESSMILDSLGADQNNLKDIINAKLDAVKDVINSNKNSFPIVAYSYYEYASTLNDINDTSSALLYSEYALNLASMNLYFSGEISRDQYVFPPNTISHITGTVGSPDYFDTFYIFVLGFILGVLVMIFQYQKRKEKEIKNQHDIYIKMKRK